MKKTTIQIIIFFVIVIIGLLADSLIFPEITPKEKRSRSRANLYFRSYSHAI